MSWDGQKLELAPRPTIVVVVAAGRRRNGGSRVRALAVSTRPHSSVGVWGDEPSYGRRPARTTKEGARGGRREERKQEEREKGKKNLKRKSNDVAYDTWDPLYHVGEKIMTWL